MAAESRLTKERPLHGGLTRQNEETGSDGLQENLTTLSRSEITIRNNEHPKYVRTEMMHASQDRMRTDQHLGIPNQKQGKPDAGQSELPR
ncbi:unnamed protein product [Protopolystoma xenopodis]|uniref:Uncharacterized protein n=1 Tax=Protopolystoma xenopodis TaxID=117903 RepID=A0A3S5A2K0_9PLAT|nr:unnamed protein product [Protopolystoma xenopodis]